MATTTTRRRRASYPISHYWGLVKDMDDSQKLQLITMLAQSVKPAEDKKQESEEYSFKPYTMEEINARIDQAERESAAGLGQDSEEMFRELEEEFAQKEELEMMEAHRQLRDVALEHSRKTMSDVITRIIKRSMNQVETEPSMTPEEAVAALRAL